MACDRTFDYFGSNVWTVLEPKRHLESNRRRGIFAKIWTPLNIYCFVTVMRVVKSDIELKSLVFYSHVVRAG